jgi:kinesin family protein 2/24
MSTKISKIRVIVRKRPANRRESSQKDIDIITTEGKNTIIVKELKNKVDLTKYIEEHRFTFDRAYADESSNQQIYEEMLKSMIDAAFKKTKITCFAYGQTGSGKTYTMLGNNHIKNDNNPQVPGLYLLSCIDIFNNLQKKEFSNLDIWVSFYEIYCNKLFDLLNNKNVLQAREDGKGNICIVGLVEKNTKNIQELLDIIDYGLTSRTVGITGANLDSSRSHAILQISIRTKQGENYSKISFIDLAGSERAVDTIDTNKKTKIDGAEINKSLLALKECIRALDLEKRHKPFRGSKLTLVLRDSFIGNCLTLMIANISPCLSCSEHTLNTLRYADRVKELRKPRHEKENENIKSGNHELSKKEKERKLLDDLLMMPKNNNHNIKYNVEIKNGDTEKINNLIINHNYNFMKIKNKNNLIEQNKDIQKPDLNILKIDDVIKNEKLPSKYAFKKNNRNSSKQMNKFSENNLLINSDVDIGNNINNKNMNYSPKEDSKSSFVYRLKTDLDKSKTAHNNFDNSDKIININEYKSKYKGMEIKSDEDYNKLSQIHEELIDEILKGEDEFIDAHKSHIDNMVEYIKKEMKFIHEVDKPGSDIEEYTNNLDKLLAQEIQTITNLRKKLVKFHIMIKDENALANLFGEDEKFSENGFEGGESTNSLEEFFISKEEMNKKAGTNINYNNKYNFQSKKK